MSFTLDRLEISNLAVIENLALTLDQGLNVITGPTGSGKTLLIDALKLALGERADYDLLSDSEDAEILAVFDVDGTFEIPFDNIDGDGTLRIARHLNQDRTSPAYVEEDRIRLKTLRTKRRRIIDFHGQHDNQAIFDNQFAREVLDRFGNYGSLLDDYHQKYRDLAELENTLDELQGDDKRQEERLELLDYQLQELEEFNPEANEWEEIEDKRRRLEDAEDIQQVIDRAIDLLEGTDSAPSMVKTLYDNLDDLEEYRESLGDWKSEIESASVALEELRRDLKEYRSEISGSTDEYDEIMDRRSEWLKLARKHNVPPEELYEHFKQLKKEAERLRNREERIEEITNELERLEPELFEIAETLQEKRSEVASVLEESVVEVLNQLNLEDALFEVDVQKTELGPNGYDRVEWLFASHSSQSLGPLDSRVSGGEISRVLLAVKSALAEADETPVLVFDEIDTGISGEEADQMGEVLENLAEYHQIICITHLPIVASRADNHVRIRRLDREDQVEVEAESLDRNDRIEELSRLLSGDESSSVSREQAKELLDQS